ncbi:MAG: ribokinase [Alphaproteobacteria bacterium]|nr:ribokinase [Alphaproteobacteria bacterium]
MIDVAVVGSLHLDIMVKAPRLPARDETLMGSAWRYKCGGKGGNQAVAAARFGARTGFGGRTGDDDFGQRLRRNLAAAGVDTGCVGVDFDRGSGMSVAIEEQAGEYGAVVVSGTNLAIEPGTITRDWAALWTCKVLLLQNEIPEAVNLAAATLARNAGATIILNAAPARPMADSLFGLIDVLIVNRVEAAMMTGTTDRSVALQRLHARGCDVVLTLGGDGLEVMTREGERIAIPALAVEFLASHGAGDCFCGALAARIAQGDDLLAACRFARNAAGLFVSTPEDAHDQMTPAAVTALGAASP